MHGDIAARRRSGRHDGGVEEPRQAVSTGNVRVCGTVVPGSRKTSLTSTLAKEMPRNVIIKVVMISFTP